MKKIYFMAIIATVSFQSFGVTGLQDIKQEKQDDIANSKVISHSGHISKEDNSQKESTIHKGNEVNKDYKKPKLKATKLEVDNCYKDSYYAIKEINKILDKNIEEPNQALFQKIKTSNLWLSLNKENKENFARMIIKWTLQGDEKITEAKGKIANYYLNHCKNL